MRNFEPKDWIITAIALALSLLGGIAASGVTWGAFKTTVANHEKRLLDIEGVLPNVEKTVANIDGKLDVVLRGSGLTYKPGEPKHGP